MSILSNELTRLLLLALSFSILPSCGTEDVSVPSKAVVELPPATPVAVWTQHNDNSRTGAVLTETRLSTTNVQRDHFGLLFSRAVKGQIYAQPLFVPDVTVPGKGKHHVIVVATEDNRVYAFDAEDPAASAPLWEVRLGEPMPSADLLIDGNPEGCPDLKPQIGITATPVIDLATSTIYVSAKTKEGSVYSYRLHALDLATGNEKLGGPVLMTPQVAGTGDGQTDGVVKLNAMKQLNRPGLLLHNGTVWLAFGSHCDLPPFHGWVLTYDAKTLKPTGVWNDTPDGYGGGIWQAGGGLAADESGVFAVSGNGDFDLTHSPAAYGDSVIKLRLGATGIEVADFFTPYNQAELAAGDVDLGSSGPLLIPGTRALVTGSKEGKLYMLNRDALGGFHAGDDSQIMQSFVAVHGAPSNHLHGSPVFFQGIGGPRLYIWGENDTLRMYRLTGGLLETTAARASTMSVPEGMPGGILSLSANGTTKGSAVLWAVHANQENQNGEKIVEGILRAFDAEDIEHELWNSKMSPSDEVGLFAKFCPPTVTNGRVYLATFSGKLQVYGLR